MPKIKFFDLLSGIFIMMIVFHHLGVYPGGGSLGVSFFFILGGFKLTLGYYDKVTSASFSYRNFLKKRASKFYPFHWLCILLMIPIIALAVQNGSKSLTTQVITLLPNALLVHSLVPIWDCYFSWNSVSWYLSNTMLFACAFPFLLKMLRNKKEAKQRFFVMGGAIFLYAVISILIPKERVHAIMYINPCVRIVDFMIGMFMAANYVQSHNQAQNKYFISSMIGLALIVACIESIILSEDIVLFSAVYWVPLCILIFYACKFQYPLRESKILNLICGCFEWCGKMSFPIFMLHKICIKYAYIILSVIGLNYSIARVLLVISSTLVLSYICNEYFIKRISLWKTK